MSILRIDSLFDARLSHHRANQRQLCAHSARSPLYTCMVPNRHVQSQIMSTVVTAKLQEQFDAGLETRADFTIDQPLARYGGRPRGVEAALCTPVGAAARARLRRIRRGTREDRPAGRSRAVIRRREPPVEAGNGLADRRGAGPRARPRVLRASREPALPRYLVDAPSRPARLPAGTRLLPRPVRPRAAADRPGVRRLHAGVRPHRARGRRR